MLNLKFEIQTFKLDFPTKIFETPFLILKCPTKSFLKQIGKFVLKLIFKLLLTLKLIFPSPKVDFLAWIFEFSNLILKIVFYSILKLRF